MCPVRTSSCWGISKRNITGTMFYWPPPPLIIIGPALTWSELILCVAEYASVGYMAKRIQMRKNRFLAIQKMAEQKKNEALHASNANINDAGNNLDLGPGLPKQTVSPFFHFSFNKSRLRTSFRWYLCCSKFELASSLRNIFPYFSFKLCLTQPPNHLRESVREIELGILDRRDLQGHLSLNCIVLEIAIARHAKALAIAKTAWFVLCLISRFAINNLIVLHIYLYITVFQHFKCPHLSSPNGIIYSGSPPKKANPDNEDCVWDKDKDNQGVEVCHPKYFWEVSPRAPTVWVKNKLCLFTTWQRRPKNPNVYFSFRPHILGGEYLYLDPIGLQPVFGWHTKKNIKNSFWLKICKSPVCWCCSLLLYFHPREKCA